MLNDCLNKLIKRLFNIVNSSIFAAMELNDKKVRILEVAEKLFAEKGFSGTSVREIAKASEVNVAMISYYFESKEKLLEAIFRYRGDYLQTKIEKLVSDDGLSSWQKLDLLIDEYVERFNINRLLHRIILRELGLNSNDKIREFINERKYQHYKIMTDFVKQAQDKGEFQEGVDLLMLYTLLPGVTKHLLFNEDLMLQVVEEDTGQKPSLESLQQRMKSYLKKTFRLLLEKK